MPWQEKKKGSVGSDSHHFVAIVVWSIRNHTRKAARRQTFHVSLSDIAVPLKTVPRRHKSSVHSTLYTYRWWLRSVLTTDGFQSPRPRSASYTKLPLRTGHTKKNKKTKKLATNFKQNEAQNTHAQSTHSGGVYVPCIYMHARWELP